MLFLYLHVKLIYKLVKVLTYWFDQEKEMIYFSNGHQSLVANGGYFFWPVEGKSVFFHEDMVELSELTGIEFIYEDTDNKI